MVDSHGEAGVYLEKGVQNLSWAGTGAAFTESDLACDHVAPVLYEVLPAAYK